MKNLSNIGFYIALYGLVLVLGWIGLFKFTPTEAKAIVPLIKNSPFMAWMYNVWSQQTVSNIIGAAEIGTALLLVTYPIAPKLSFIGGILASFTFLATISFIFTTPNAIEKIDGFWLPDAFILKDVMALGLSLWILSQSYLQFNQE